MPSLYILKAICSFLIVFIHLPGITIEATILQPIMRIGVPVFLMISGYFLVSDKNISTTNIIKQLKKILLLTITVYVIYIGFHIIRNIILDKPAITSQWMSINFWIRTILIGDNIDSILWYLNAYVESLVIIWGLLKFFNSTTVIRILFSATPFLLFAAILLNRYSFLLNTTLDIAISRNAILIGIPCITLGIIVNIHHNFFSRISNIVLIIMFLTLLAYGEYTLLHIYNLNGSGADFNLLTFPLAYSIFIYCILNPELPLIPVSIQAKLIDMGKYCSGDIYLYHSLAWGIIGLITITSSNNLTSLFTNAEAVILIVLVFSTIKHKLRKQRWILVQSR